VIQVPAVGDGVLAGLSYLMRVLGRPELATAVRVFAFVRARISAVFCFGRLLSEGALQNDILKDETIIKGDNCRRKLERGCQASL